MNDAQATPNVSWKAIALLVCISISIGMGFQYLGDRTFANGLGAGTIVVWAAVGIVLFLFALRGRSSTSAVEENTSLVETVRTPGLPWYKQPYQWFFAAFIGGKTFMEVIDAGKGWKSASLQGFATLAFIFLFMAALIPLLASCMQSPPSLFGRKP